MIGSRLLLAVPLLVLALFTNVARAQHSIPICADTCGGGIQPKTTGGDALQKWASVPNQRGMSGALMTTRPTGRSTHIEGSQSYTYALPLFDIPGRGLSLHLALYYNSLVWQFNSENNSMVYAAEFDTPSPGFTLGYGVIDFSTDQAVGVLTEPTGAMHLLLPSSFPNYKTTDSSYIQVVYPTTAGGSAIATFKDGLRAFYQPFTVLVNGRTQYRPYQIEDTNGNFISITYADPNDLNISTITDTVGRVIQFIYDSTGKMLQDVNQLDASGNVFRQYAFTWAQNQTLTFNFNLRATAGLGLAPGYYTSGQSQVNLLTKVTRPDGTSVGFDYGYGPGGNPDWGVVKTITEFSSSGIPRYTTGYTFPAANAGALTKTPTYSQQVVNDGVNTKIWTYQATVTAQGLVKSSVITDPCGNTMTTTFSSAGDAADGMPIKEEMANTQPAPAGCPATPAQTWRTANKTWTTDVDGSNPRLQAFTSVLEDGTSQSQVKFNTYDAFGQVTDLLEYNIGANGPGPLLKEVVTTFASLGNGIVNRPSSITVKDKAANTVSLTNFNYDDYSVVGITDISPNTVGHDPAFASSNAVRGNLTSMTSFANAAAATGGVNSTFTYDAAGNRLTSKGGCCTVSQQTFSANTNYAFPDSMVAGPSNNSLSLTTSFTYNLLTGTLATTKNSNGQMTSYSYDVDNRPVKTTFPDLSTISQSYDDSSANSSITVSNSFNSLVGVTTATGPTVTQQVKNGTALVSTKTVTSDLLGRPVSVINPFGPSETALYTTYAYDPLGRVTQVTPPATPGGSVVCLACPPASYQTSYGLESTSIDATAHMVQTVTSTDPAGKQSKRYTDGLGLRQVDEPGPSGGQAGSGSISFSGTEQSVSVQSGGSATAGTGSVTVGGTERSTVVRTHNATSASINVTIGGSDSTNIFTTCARNRCFSHKSPDAGTIRFTANVGGITVGPVQVNYDGTSTPASLAAALYAAFPANSQVTMSNPNGSSSFTLSTAAASSASNSASFTDALVSGCDQSSDLWACGGVGWTMTLSGPNLAPTTAASASFTGGSDNIDTTFYDTGTATVSVTINGTVYSKVSNYSQNTTASGIASDLANKINSDTTLNQLLIASSSGNVLNLTTTATGVNTADPLSVSAVTTSQYFTSGSSSFTATPSGTTLTPGQNGVIFDTGTVTVSIAGFTATPRKYTANYKQGSTAGAIASAIAGAITADSLTPVRASASGGVISLTARTLGADTNYTVTSASATTQPGYFTQPSFSGAATSLSGGQDASVSLQTPLSTYYFYDALGRLLQANQGAQQRVYAYDDLGRVTSAKLPETQNQATTYTYTDQGLNQGTDPRGIVTTYAYDALGRVNQISYSDQTPVITYTYGSAGAANFGSGRVTKVVDGSGTATFQYDLMGRPTQISRTIGVQTYITSYAYTNGQLSTITYPSGRTVNMTPDAIGRLSAVGSNGSNLLTIGSYNAAGEVLGATYGNGMTANYTYNNQLQLASLVSGSATTPVLNLTYNYGANNNGQIQGITDGISPSQSTSYSYDELGRLKTAQTSDLTSPNTWKLKFSYDRYGNRLSEVPAAGAASMPFSEIAVDPATNHIIGLQYDAAGNVTNDGLHTYTYNAGNKITQVDGAGTFTYDVGGHRVSKNGTVYIYHNGLVMAEYPNGAAPSSPSVEYVGRLASFAGGTTTYYYSDHLSIRVLADASGKIIGRQTQFPFGELVAGLQPPATTKWQFTSYERDLAIGDSGLDYAQARFYASSSGRFTSLDPMAGNPGNPQSLNRYVYAGNDPINSVDPTGMLHGRLTCLLNEHGDCVGGNGYAPGQGGWGDAQLLTNDSMSIFSDPFGPMVDPTKWDPMAEAEKQYDQQVKLNQAMNQAHADKAVVIVGSDGVVHVLVFSQTGTPVVYHPPDADHPNGWFSTTVSGHWTEVTFSTTPVAKEELDPMGSVVDFFKWAFRTKKELEDKPGGATRKDVLKFNTCATIAAASLYTKGVAYADTLIAAVAGLVLVAAPPTAPVSGVVAAAAGLGALISAGENWLTGEAGKLVGCGFK